MKPRDVSKFIILQEGLTNIFVLLSQLPTVASVSFSERCRSLAKTKSGSYREPFDLVPPHTIRSEMKSCASGEIAIGR